MLDIDWHGDSYRRVPQLFHLRDSVQLLMKFDGGDAGWAFVTVWASTPLASSLELNTRRKHFSCGK